MIKSAPNQLLRKRCFDPVVDVRTRLLLLGSLPGEKSLEIQQYYGNRQNKFWKLVGAVLNVDLCVLSYDVRLDILLSRGVGLWDVIAEADRPGSLDANITNAYQNALTGLIGTLPNLRAVAFNGAIAARLGRKQLRAFSDRLCLVDLPSSSPAHTVGFEQKLQAWCHLAEHL